jgi:hypothetical protein
MIVALLALMKLNSSNCRILQLANEISLAFPSSANLQMLILGRNEFFDSQRRFAAQFGTHTAKCLSLTKIELSQNALTSNMAVALLPGLSDAPRTHQLNVSRKTSTNQPAAHLPLHCRVTAIFAP